MKSKRNGPGFTLLEMVIVIVLLGILIGVMVPSYIYYAGLARASRIGTYASTMMTSARLANYSYLAGGTSIPSTDLIYGWPTSAAICGYVNQQMANGPDAALTSSSTPISCTNGVLQDTTASVPSVCSSTYNQSTSSGTTAYVDITSITPSNCM